MHLQFELQCDAFICCASFHGKFDAFVVTIMVKYHLVMMMNKRKIAHE